MQNSIICPNCKQSVEPGALFCGNCGYSLQLQPASQPVQQAPTTSNQAVPQSPVQSTPLTQSQPVQQPITPQPPVQSNVSQVYSNGPANNIASPSYPPVPMTNTGNANIPSYAIAQNNSKQHWVIIALIVGVFGIASGILLMPILGVILGVIGIVLYTVSYKYIIGPMKILGIAFPILALLSGLGTWTYNMVSLSNSTNGSYSTSSSPLMSVNTPCFSFKISSAFKVSNSKGSCNVKIYNGSSLSASTQAYDIFSMSLPIGTSINQVFNSTAVKAYAQQITKQGSNFKITNQGNTTFEGQSTYFINGYYKHNNNLLSFFEDIVYNPNSNASNGDNFYIIAAVNENKTDNLNYLKNNWQWQ